MSKFTDRLERLHASRVRALDESEKSGDHKRVFHASEVSEQQAADEPPSEERPTQTESTRPESPARTAVRETLRRGKRLKSGGRRKLKMRRADSKPPTDRRSEDAPAPAPSRGESDGRQSNPVGERLAELRVQAEALIEVGAVESALPMLHEMLALSPNNPYPLSALARYWRSKGDETLARLYEARLRKTAPY